MSSIKYTVSAVKVLIAPPFRFPAQGSNTMKNPKKVEEPYSPLDDLAAQASSESVRGPKSMGKHKLKWTQGPKTWENVGSERHLPAKTSSRDSKGSGELSGYSQEAL